MSTLTPLPKRYIVYVHRGEHDWSLQPVLQDGDRELGEFSTPAVSVRTIDPVARYRERAAQFQGCSPKQARALFGQEHLGVGFSYHTFTERLKGANALIGEILKLAALPAEVRRCICPLRGIEACNDGVTLYVQGYSPTSRRKIRESFEARRKLYLVGLRLAVEQWRDSEDLEHGLDDYVPMLVREQFITPDREIRFVSVHDTRQQSRVVAVGSEGTFKRTDSFVLRTVKLNRYSWNMSDGSRQQIFMSVRAKSLLSMLLKLRRRYVEACVHFARWCQHEPYVPLHDFEYIPDFTVEHVRDLRGIQFITRSDEATEAVCFDAHRRLVGLRDLLWGSSSFKLQRRARNDAQHYETVNPLASNEITLGKFEVDYRGRRYELQFLPVRDYLNIRWSRATEHHARYRRRQVCKYLLPWLFPEAIYGQNWNVTAEE